MNKKQKFQKQKRREKTKKKELQEKRLAKRAEVRHQRKVDAVVDASRPKETPARNTDKIKKQLEENMKILEALEQEYLSEEERRDKINTELEAEGCHTGEEKVKRLVEKFKEKIDEGQEIS